MEDYKEAINLTNSIEYMEKDIGESQIKLKETEGKLESLEDDVRDGESQDLDQITKDYNL